MEYLIRLAQVHESFRKPEILALATLAGIKVEFLVYDERVRTCRDTLLRLWQAIHGANVLGVTVLRR